MQKKNDFTQGRVGPLILKVSLPMIGAQIINALYSMVDKMYIGRLPGGGAAPLAGVGITFPFIMIVSAFACLAGMGGAPLCSIARGQGKEDEAERIMGGSFAFLLLLGIGVTILALLVKEPVLIWFGATDEVLHYAAEYLDIYLTGSLFVMMTLGMNPFINSQGFTRMGMLTVAIGAVLNTLLDPLFMFTMGMGVKGAALATVISQAISAGWVLFFLTGKKCILRLRRKYIRLDGAIIKKVASLGISSCTMSITDCIVSVVCNRTLALFGGPTYLSVMTVISSIRQILMMPVSGFGQGMQPVMGYNYGAGRYDRVKKCFYFTTLVSALYATFVCLVTQFFPAFFIGLFGNDPSLLEAGVPALRVYFCLFFMLSMQMAGQYSFVALGKSRQAIFFSLLRKAFIVAPLTLILPRVTNLGVMGVFVAEPVSDMVGSTACFVTFIITMWPSLKKNPAEARS